MSTPHGINMSDLQEGDAKLRDIYFVPAEMVELFGKAWLGTEGDTKIARLSREGLISALQEAAQDAMTDSDARGILGEDWTGDMDSVEWVRRQRD